VQTDGCKADDTVSFISLQLVGTATATP